MRVRVRESTREREMRGAPPRAIRVVRQDASETVWERESRGNHERVITQCDLARVGQLYDQHRRAASSRGHAAE